VKSSASVFVSTSDMDCLQLSRAAGVAGICRRGEGAPVNSRHNPWKPISN
jgi:hypothetical protein